MRKNLTDFNQLLAELKDLLDEWRVNFAFLIVAKNTRQMITLADEAIAKSV